MAHSAFPASYVTGDRNSPAPDVTTGPQEAGGCPACPHAPDDHDPVGLRFCRATTTGTAPGSEPRGCICRS